MTLLEPSLDLQNNCNLINPASNFNFSVCRNIAGTLFKCNPEHPYLVHGKGTLTLAGCLALCGDGYEEYQHSDVLNAIATWNLPLFLLVLNMTYAPYGWLTIFASAAQLLGNPIGTLRGLLGKLARVGHLKKTLERSNIYPLERLQLPGYQCGITLNCQNLRARVVRDFATVLVALDDIPPPPGQSHLDLLISYARSDPVETLHAVEAAAGELCELRINNRIPAISAILLYVLSVVIAYLQTFVIVPENADGDNGQQEETLISNHIPHTIAFRQLYYWLLTTVLLSAYVGYFPSRRSSMKILMTLLERLNEEATNNKLANDYELKLSKPYDGGVYSWRIRSYRNYTQDKKPLSTSGILCHALSFLSVTLSFILAFLLSWFTPTKGMGCRSLTQVGFWAAWVISYLLTEVMSYIHVHWCKAKNDKWLWAMVSLKDGLLFGLPMIIVLHAAFKGWWNSCTCWSGRWSRHFDQAYIDLFMERQIKALGNRGLLPGLVGGAIFAQVLCFVTMCLVYREGIRIFNRNEVVVHKEFRDRVGLKC